MNFGFARYLPRNNSPGSSPRACSDFATPASPSVPAYEAATTYKCALSFILSPPSSPEPAAIQLPALMSPLKTVKRKRTESADVAAAFQYKAPRPSAFSTSPQVVIKTEYTVAAPINNAAPVLKKGSKFCIVDGCMSRAKHAKRCWRHGGSVKCKVVDCANRAKSKGVCWSHGGGTLCSADGCDTISVSHGFCWAHGGGKRCMVSQCSKPAYERTQNYCTTHFEQLPSFQ